MDSDKLNINSIKLLSMDMIENARSGHPGMILGCTPAIYFLFNQMKFNPSDPHWINRDRFVLSNGHGCALLYSILHLYGYNYSINDLKKFRSIDSKTPGHPEKNLDLGIEVTTGPLGQGISNGVGMAISSKILEAKFNIGEKKLIDHNIYVMCGDGCLMEGISNESISLAGSLCLDNLILIYDDNKITIDGKTDLTFTENTEEKFKSMGWDTFIVRDGNSDYEDIKNKISLAKKSCKPSIIILKTLIGFDTEKENSEKCHGSPLGEEIVSSLKRKYGFDVKEKFTIKNEVSKFFGMKIEEKKNIYNLWNEILNDYRNNNDEIFGKYNYFLKHRKKEMDINVSDTYKSLSYSREKISTRKLSGIMLDLLIKNEFFILGSADLATSNCIPVKNVISKNNFNGNYIHFGVREHAMCGIANGIETYGFTPIVGTFLIFSSYALPSIRLAALSNHKIIYILTHDSIALGEDGPTHQPIESLTILRSIPNLLTFRPADRCELLYSYKLALRYKCPSCICLSRQDLYNLEEFTSDDCLKGAYTVFQSNTNVKLILISSGSDLSLTINVAKKLKIPVRVISMLSFEIFENQIEDYKEYILPKNILKISIESGSTLPWYKYADICYGLDNFGSSGNGKDVLIKHGFVEDSVLKFIESKI